METKKKVNRHGKEVDVYDGLTNSTQTFGGIGCFDVASGDIVLRGREGERDHIIPLEKAVKKYSQLCTFVRKLCMHGVRGWDTLGDISDDLKRKLLEAIDLRRKLNMDIPQDALDFEKMHRD